MRLFSEPTFCEVPSCERTTSARKPYCSHHVHLSPYVRELLSSLEEQRREIAAVRRRGPKAVDLEGLTARNLLLELEHAGATSIAGLGRRLMLEERVLESYLGALGAAGRVQPNLHANGRVSFSLPLDP